MIKKYLPRIVLPLISIAVGFLSAYLAANVHSIFFVLLPLLAFVLSYFSSWGLGLLCGLLLFLGYTFATILLESGGWDESYHDYFISAFGHGGILLLFIGALTPVVRSKIRKSGIRNVASATVLVTLVCLMIWCGSLAWTQARTYCTNYYNISISFSEGLDVELYLPTGAISGVIDEELYKESYSSLEFVDTEYGRMMKLIFSELPTYSANSIDIYITFWDPMYKEPPHKLIQLIPRYDVVSIDKSEGNRVEVEEFKVPIMVKSNTDAEFSLFLQNITWRSTGFNFTRCYKKNHYWEQIYYKKAEPVTNGCLCRSR